MRHLLRATCLIAALAACTAQAWAQRQPPVKLRVGLRAGAATSDLQTGEVLFRASGRDFGLALEDAKYALHAGLFAQLRVRKLIVQPEVLFTSTRVDYRLREFTAASIIETLREESTQRVDLPLMLGYKLGPLRLQGGPVGHVFVSRASDLAGVADYLDDPEKFTLGYQAGLGVDLWNVLLDFKYQGALRDAGAELSFGGQEIAFGQRPGQLVMSLGFSFN